MKRKYGLTTNYSHVSDYKGFAIVAVINTTITRFSEHKDVHYIASITGQSKQPWKKSANRISNSYGSKIEDVKEQIDSFVTGKTPIITVADRKKYVKKYNNKNDCGFNRRRLLATMKRHKDGDAKMKILMEDRLEDANYHGYCGDLLNRNYVAFMKRLNEEFPLN